MTDDATLFHQLDEVFATILAGASGRLRAARSIATTLRRSQSQRIARQETPEGGKFEKRRRRVLRSQAGIRFVWNGEVRRLKNWQASRGSRGRKLTGFDEDRGACARSIGLISSGISTSVLARCAGTQPNPTQCFNV
jgi:hypothetical protein